MNHKKGNGYILPYTLFLSILVLNMVIFVVLCILSTKKLYNDQNNHYHFFICQNRIRNHITEMINENKLVNNYNETLYYDETLIVLTYKLDTTKKRWVINYRIEYHNDRQLGSFIYDIETGILRMEMRII